MKQNSCLMSGKYKVGEDALPHFVTFSVVGWIDVFSREGIFCNRDRSSISRRCRCPEKLPGEKLKGQHPGKTQSPCRYLPGGSVVYCF